MADRLPSLDLLRFAAVLLVMGRHSYPMYYWDYGPLAFVSDFGKAYGWLGVDLFFVLSGFLVSGLLFKELQRNGKIAIRRFYVRRGFKIYPAFYFLILASPLIVPAWKNYLSEIFFYQNYIPNTADQSYLPVWGHTWSLAIEEHFYLLLPWVLILFLPKRLPIIFAVTAVSCLAGRLLFAEPGEFIYLTHLRLDSLFFGVLLSYYHHYGSLEIIKNRPCVLSGFALLLLIAFVPFTIAYTFAYLGFGVIMVNFLEFKARGFGFFSYLGAHSYSIYLWHEAVRMLIRPLFPASEKYALLLNIVWIGLAFAAGIIMAKLIELPFLTIRDRIPSLGLSKS